MFVLELPVGYIYGIMYKIFNYFKLFIDNCRFFRLGMANPRPTLESFAAREIFQIFIKKIIFAPIEYSGMSAQRVICIINNVIATEVIILI